MTLPDKIEADAPTTLDLDESAVTRWKPGFRSVWESESRLGYLLLMPSVLFLLVVTLLPFVYGLWVSFLHWPLTNPSIPRTFVGLQNYRELLHDPSFFTALNNTLYFTGMSVGLSLLIGFSLALLLHHVKRGKGIYLTLLLLPMVSTPVVIALGFRYMYDPSYGVITKLLSLIGFDLTLLGSPNLALPSVIAVEVWEWTPFMALVLFAGLESLPPRVFEAAAIDGASWIQAFRRITLPQMRNVILIAVLIRTMDAMRSFDLIFMMTKGGPGEATETLAIYSWRESFSFFNMGRGAALAMMMFYITLAVSWILVKASGAGKGPSGISQAGSGRIR
jgi:multiple sugar transport system permease protein